MSMTVSSSEWLEEAQVLPKMHVFVAFFYQSWLQDHMSVGGLMARYVMVPRWSRAGKTWKKVVFKGSKIRRIGHNIYQLFIYFQTELFVWDPMKNLNLPQNNQFVGLQKRRMSAIWSFLLLIHVVSQKRVLPVLERSVWEISQRLGNWRLWWLCHLPQKPETHRYMHFVHRPSLTLFCVFTCLITSPIIFEVKLSLPRKQLELCSCDSFRKFDTLVRLLLMHWLWLIEL